MSPNIYPQPNIVYSNDNSATLESAALTPFNSDYLFKSSDSNQFTTNPLFAIENPTGEWEDVDQLS